MAQLEEPLKLIDKEFFADKKTTKNESVICSTGKKMDEKIIQGQSASANVLEDRNSILESIIDDCLLYICEHLEFIDVVNLAATCVRLQSFANDNVFLTKADYITIAMPMDDNDNEAHLIVPSMSISQGISKIRLENLETSLSYFGQFVKYCTIKSHFFTYKSKIRSIASTVLENCENLTSLCLDRFHFTLDETHALHAQIESVKNLEKLDLGGCTGIINNWPATTKSISKVKILKVATSDEFKIHFFDQFRHLSSLTIDFEDFAWRSDDLAMIFELNSDCLKHLIMIDYYNDVIIDYDSIFTVITDKLPKLERLDFKGDFPKYSSIMTKLHHFKSLEVDFHVNNFNLIMHAIDKAIIKKLKISFAYFEEDAEEDTNEPPPIFNELKYFGLFNTSSSNFLNILTTSEMPKIHTFEFHHDADERQTEKLLKFYESKKTLNSLILYWDSVESIPQFLSQIIEILKKPCSPNRPFLNLKIKRNLRRSLTAEDMELVNFHRHLIKVEQINPNS